MKVRAGVVVILVALLTIVACFIQAEHVTDLAPGVLTFEFPNQGPYAYMPEVSLVPADSSAICVGYPDLGFELAQIPRNDSTRDNPPPEFVAGPPIRGEVVSLDGHGRRPARADDFAVEPARVHWKHHRGIPTVKREGLQIVFPTLRGFPVALTPHWNNPHLYGRLTVIDEDVRPPRVLLREWAWNLPTRGASEATILEPGGRVAGFIHRTGSRWRAWLWPRGQ